MDLPDERAYTPRQVGQLINVSRGYVYVLMKTGQLGYIQFKGTRRIPAAALRRFMSERTVGGEVAHAG